ncbi:MAG: NAD(P)/FAD-dependent oxidoreductase [Acidimicrobiales bacterium]
MSQSSIAGGGRPRVVIVGGGFGGVAAARALRTVRADVTLVDRHNYHGFWPLLYQVASAGLAADDIAHNLRGIFRESSNLDTRMATVTGVDFEARLVHLHEGPPLPYGWLILAAGSVSDDFGIPGVSEHGFPLKSLPDALALRNHVLEHFEQAHTDPALLDAGFLTVVVAGGGPTGVEVSGALTELFRVLEDDIGRGLHARVVLVEMVDHLLAGFHPSLQAEALRTLQGRNVDVRLRTKIASAGPDSVTLDDGTVIPTRTLVWAAGVRASHLADALGVEQRRNGTLVVEDDLSLPGHPEVFAIGDMAAGTDAAGRPLPMVAPVAQQGARHAVACISRRLAGKPTSAFRYVDKGKMATIGRRSAVADLPLGIRLVGTPGWLSWLGLHLVLLVGTRNRAAVFLDWAWNYLTWDRGNRIILKPTET